MPVWPTWNLCGYQPASVTARDAPDGGAEGVGQFLDDLEPVGGADAAAAGDHDRGLGQLGAFPGFLDDLLGDPGPLGRLADRDVDGLQVGGGRGGLGGDRVGPDGDDRGAGLDRRVDDGGPAEHRLLGDDLPVLLSQADRVAEHARSSS